jgi:hypothetical protein
MYMARFVLSVFQQQYGNNVGHKWHCCTLIHKLQPPLPFVDRGKQVKSGSRGESILPTAKQVSH